MGVAERPAHRSLLGSVEVPKPAEGVLVISDAVLLSALVLEWFVLNLVVAFSDDKVPNSRAHFYWEMEEGNV